MEDPIVEETREARRQLDAEFGGDDIIKSGVGRKTANVVLSKAFKISIVVDTRSSRLRPPRPDRLRRLGEDRAGSDEADSEEGVDEFFPAS